MAITLDGSNANTLGLINAKATQNTTSGTFVDFTGIPANVRRVTVVFNGVSTNGSSYVQVQVGAGSVATTGYNATSSAFGTSTLGVINSTSGFPLYANVATNTTSGHLVFTTVGSNIWVCSGVLKNNTPATCLTAGDVTLSGTLDRVRISTTNGTDVFDAGSMNVLYE